MLTPRPTAPKVTNLSRSVDVRATLNEELQLTSPTQGCSTQCRRRAVVIWHIGVGVCAAQEQLH